MAVTYYVALPFVRTEEGVAPSQAREMPNEGAAITSGILNGRLNGRRMKSVIALPASYVMHRHPAFDRCQESYPRRSELHQNCYSHDGDEQSAVPAGV